MEKYAWMCMDTCCDFRIVMNMQILIVNGFFCMYLPFNDVYPHTGSCCIATVITDIC